MELNVIPNHEYMTWAIFNNFMSRNKLEEIGMNNHLQFKQEEDTHRFIPNSKNRNL